MEIHRIEVERILQKYPMISNVRVFGSVARNEDREDSDLDLYVDVLPGATLLDLWEFKKDFAILLGVSVDLVTSNADLLDTLKRNIERDARPIDKIST